MSNNENKPDLRLLPLGGLGNIGKNMMLIEIDDQILIIDVGLMFPTSDMLGIDVVLPDTDYLYDRFDDVTAVILSHGHEDHIGALPFLMEQGLNAPVYATALTRGLLEGKLSEHKLLDKAKLNTVTADNELLQLGPFGIEFFHTNHSFPDSVGVSIMTSLGRIIHTSDYRLDDTPADGKPTDLAKLEKWGNEGVLLMTADSTNAEQTTATKSEKIVEESIEEVFRNAEGRILIATFASNVGRVQQIIDVARRQGRRVGVIGRSMVNNVKVGIRLGYLDITQDELLSTGEMESLSPSEVVVIATGSQGEPTSAMVRMSVGNHRQITLNESDTVILSASPIPGNEEFFNRTLDNLFRLGVDVVYHELAEVHVSGHGGRADYAKMLETVKPQYFVPAHGEYRHLVLHGRLAQEVGMPKENVFVIEDGQPIDFNQSGNGVTAKRGDLYQSRDVMVDGLGVGDIGNVVLRDRRLLGQNGFIVCVVVFDEIDGDIIYGPEIISRGFVYMRDNDDMIRDAEKLVRKAVKKRASTRVRSGKVKDALLDFCQKEMGRRPMVLPVVLEV